MITRTDTPTPSSSNLSLPGKSSDTCLSDHDWEVLLSSPDKEIITIITPPPTPEVEEISYSVTRKLTEFLSYWIRKLVKWNK